MYYLIIALQVFCIYHLFKNRNNYYWVFAILFLPLIGSLVYLFSNVIRKNDVAKVQDELTTIINPTKKINDLIKQLQFADTFTNRVNLADAYVEIKDYKNAIIHYEESLKGNFQNDYYVIQQLITCNFYTKAFDKVIEYSNVISNNPDFVASKGQFFFGQALEQIGDLEKAEIELRKVDRRYSNYSERLVLAHFLIRNDKKHEAKQILEEILIEAQHMNKNNKRLYKTTIAEVRKTLNQL